MSDSHSAWSSSCGRVTQAKTRFLAVGGAKNLVATVGGGRIMRGVRALLVAVSR